ncbi:lipopolysaccharide assembly protein LapA domain-containing protein [Sneathiella limimaris]|uniref:lipopolysaccharide assembly protein LapA domain-containing protein n=1 Tax=Sneathiella limimaris TaxID=1964213 RepID=UPI00146E7AE7
MKLISWIFVVLLGLAVIILSIGNRESVTFSLFPLPYVMEIPLFILILGGAFLGVILGAIRTWISDGKARSENRANKQEILRLKGEIARLEKEKAAQNKAVGQDAKHLLQLTNSESTSSKQSAAG